MDLYAIFQSPLCVPDTIIFSISFERFVRLAAAVELLIDIFFTSAIFVKSTFPSELNVKSSNG